MQAAGRPETAALFFDVYDALDPGCGVVAVSIYSGRLAGSCFHHPRPAPQMSARLPNASTR